MCKHNKPSWNDTFMSLTKTFAQRSDDPDTQLGAIVVDPKSKAVVSSGYNGLPRGVATNDLRTTRPTKYDYMVHAEANAVYNAARLGIELEDCILYCAWPPCHNCAMAIIQSGISAVIVETNVIRSSWKHSMEIALNMLHEAGVDIHLATDTNGTAAWMLESIKDAVWFAGPAVLPEQPVRTCSAESVELEIKN
jgi:dCMP deaminase